MTTTPYSVDAQNIADTPTQLGLVSQINAILAPLLTTLIEGASFTSQKDGRSLGYALKLDFVGVSGAPAMANPFTVQAFVAYTDAALVAQVQTYATANPAAFISPIFKQYLRNAGVTQQVVGLVFVNPVYADGSSHFGGSGGGGSGPTGPAGGDLSGTYPNPIVGPRTSGYVNSGAIPAAATVIDSAPIASVSDIEWELELIKGSTRYSTTLRANINDGVTPVWGESGEVIGPPIGGTFDAPLSCTISGGNINLVCTPATTGWSMRYRSRVLPV